MGDDPRMITEEVEEDLDGECRETAMLRYSVGCEGGGRGDGGERTRNKMT